MNANATYDTHSRPAVLTHPTGFAVENVYSSLGYLQEVRSANDGLVYWQAKEYDARGQAALVRLGNGLTTARTFDREGRPRAISTGPGTGSAVQDLAYAFDPHGNLAQRTDRNQQLPGGGALTETFTYDALFRLTGDQ